MKCMMFAQNILFSDVIELLLEYLIDKLLTSIYYLFTMVDDGRVWSMTTDWVVQCAFLSPFFGNKHRQSGMLHGSHGMFVRFLQLDGKSEIFFHGVSVFLDTIFLNSP